MRSGYNILWTAHTKNELEKKFEYLSENISEKEIQNLVQKIEYTTKLISQNPPIFPKSEFNNIHKVVILKFNSLYYQQKNDTIEILSFFSNRQSPKKRKL